MLFLAPTGLWAHYKFMKYSPSVRIRWWHAYHSSINLFIIEELNIRTVNGVYDAVGSF